MAEQNDNKPKMHRLGNPEPELKRLHPLSEEAPSVPTVEELEAVWSEPGAPETPKQRRFSTVWVGLLACGVIITTIVISNWQSADPPVVEQEPIPTLPTAAERRSQINDRLQKFFAAETTEGRLEFVMEPDRVGPAVEDYYSNQRTTPLVFKGVEEFHFVLLAEHPWCWAKFTDADSISHVAGMKETADGYKLDWETMVAYGELSWAELLDHRPAAPVQMRVYLTHSDYHNFKYADREAYAAFKIEPREDGPELYGFAPKGSRTHGQLLAVVAPGMRQPVNVKLSFEQDAGGDNVVLIDEVLHRQWTSPSVSAPEPF